MKNQTKRVCTIVCFNFQLSLLSPTTKKTKTKTSPGATSSVVPLVRAACVRVRETSILRDPLPLSYLHREQRPKTPDPLPASPPRPLPASMPRLAATQRIHREQRPKTSDPLPASPPRLGESPPRPLPASPNPP